MDTRILSKSTPVLGTFDVVVCGGGPSGIFAAIAASEHGARTLLIEKYGFLGGMATAGLVGPMSKFNLGGERIVGGLPLKFVERMAEGNGAIIDLPSGNVPFDPEMYKTTASNMVTDSGVCLLLHSLAIGCEEPEDGSISHVFAHTPSGTGAFSCRFLIDCTGTGNVIAETSHTLRNHAERGRDLQPMSLIFRLGGVDTESIDVLMVHDGVKYRNLDLRTHLQQALEQGEISNFGGPWVVWGSVIRPGYVSVNATRFSGNAVDVTDITTAETTMRREIEAIVRAFQANAPGFSSCFLSDVATQVGIRETRCIDGTYTVTGEDIVQPAIFADSIALGGHPVDMHHPGNSDQTVRFLETPYGIPFRSIVPKGSRNILVGGGLISADRDAFASVRVQAQCMAIGQAAGTAAALCTKHSVDVNDVDVELLVDNLITHGAIVRAE